MYGHITQRTHPLSVSCRYVCRFLILIFTLLPQAGTLVAQIDKDTPALELGKPVERELAGEHFHSYQIILKSGQYTHIVVDQRGIDVVVTLFSSEGKKIIAVDSPNGTRGPEPLSYVAETSGSYRLEVRSLDKDAPSGHYEAKIEELRAATEQDESRVAAELAFMQAESLYDRGTAESLQHSIKKYEESLALSRAAGDRSGETVTLNRIAWAYDRLGDRSKALIYYMQALPLTRAIGDRAAEAATLRGMGADYVSLGDQQKALGFFMQALPLSRAARDRAGEGTTLNLIGRVWDDLGERQKALYYYNQALPITRALGDRRGEANTLHNIGRVYNSLGEKPKALDYYNQALTLWRGTGGDRRGEAATLNNIGLVYDSLGEKERVLGYYNEALSIYREVGDRQGEAAALSNIGRIYDYLGENEKSLHYDNQALLLYRAIGNRVGEAAVLNNIGAVYYSLGENRRALDYYNQALPLYRAIGDRGGEATALVGISSIHYALGEKPKALVYLNQALPLYRAIGEHDGEATVLNNIGVVYNSLGENANALIYLNQALPLYRTVGDRYGEAGALHNIGGAYNYLGDKQKAIDYLIQALPVRRTVGDRLGEAATLVTLMAVWSDLRKPALAILHGKQAVNTYQQLRSSIRGLEQDLQKTYLRTIENWYRQLANLLISENRLPEAHQVLNLFKDQEFFDQVRQTGSTDSAQAGHLDFTASEDGADQRYRQAMERLAKAGQQHGALRRQLSGRRPTDAEAQQLAKLDIEFKATIDELVVLLKQFETEFSKGAPPATERLENTKDTINFQATLRRLNQQTGSKAVAVYTVVGEEKSHALIVTADGIASVSQPIRRTELNEQARQLWALLQSPDYDPRPLSNRLSKAIFQPIEYRLPKDTKTIMWSLDENLRYLPMAALYDGKQYLVERYNHVVFTRADQERLTRSVAPTWTGYGFSSSAQHTVSVAGTSVTFSSLDFAKDEMEIFRTKSYPNGIIDGDVFPEERFTKASLLATLKEPRRLVHISSHFKFRPGDESRSFLLLGDGQVMTLAEMKQQANLFHGVELLTLSACDTAAQRPDATGREVDGFAELAQRLGAGGVMASLWAVRDQSTAHLMKGFYKNRQGGNTKAKALRQAQLDLLYGRNEPFPLPNTTGDPTLATSKGNRTSDEEIVIAPKYRIPFKVDKKRPFAHPYYWSPFVLFGNWK